MSNIPVNDQTKQYLNNQKLKNIIAYKESLVRDFKSSASASYHLLETKGTATTSPRIEIVWHGDINNLDNTEAPGLKYYQKTRKALFESLNKLVKKLLKTILNNA